MVPNGNFKSLRFTVSDFYVYEQFKRLVIFTAQNKTQNIGCICHTGARNAGFCGKYVIVD
jgi:hypothetical protein